VTNINYFLFPFTIFVFFVAEILNALYIRFLGEFDDLDAGKNHFFGSNAELFWVVLGGIQIVYFLLLVIRYFFVYLFVLFSNEKIHDDMVFGLLRSPCSFFDTTPSGQLSNKFSNDLGIIDNTMAFTMVDAIEGPTVALTLLIGVFAIDLLFIVPGVLSVIFLLVFFTYCKDAIVLAKQLYLRLKSPVFGMVNEMISGLIQIRLFDRRGTLLN
jgi:ATP-binding cassette subfamily C (CFTR/MRP) protein 1